MSTKVTLREKKIASGKISLYLDFYPPIINPKTGKESRREFLGLSIYENPKTVDEKKHNSSTLNIAETIRATRFLQIKNHEFGLPETVKLNTNFITFYEQNATEQYNQTSYSNYLSWLAGLKHFKYCFGTTVMSENIDIIHIKKYRAYLLNAKTLRNNSEKKLSINTASTYYKHFIYILKKAYKQNIIKRNLAEHADFIKERETYREYLTEEELKVLWKTPIKKEVIKHMAIFTSLTGLRFVDVNNLVWTDIYRDVHQNYYINLRESKTQSIKNHPISNTAYEILKIQKQTGDKIFGEIKYSEIVRPLKEWIIASGIKKKISFHNFRHSYATLQLANGTDIYTVSKLLGHKNVSTTQIYTKVLDKNKIEAANRINLNLDGIS